MTICCLPVTHFKCKYSDILKDKGWKKMSHANANPKKPRVAILTLNRVGSEPRVLPGMRMVTS